MLTVVLTALLLQVTSAAYCSGSPDEGERTNDFPIFDEPLRFVRSVKNAAMYEAGPANATFPVIHVFGDAYEVGFAMGTIQKESIIKFVTTTWTYLVEMVVEDMDDKYPPEAQAKIVSMGMKKALDWTVRTTAPFTPQPFIDEMQGLADATGLDYDLVMRVNMLAELTKASCSFFGAWGSAVGNTGKSYQLRSLDYDIDGPFKDFSTIIVYHPTDGGHPYSEVGWAGSIGALTGFSSAKIALSEIGVSFPDDSFGQGTDNTPPEKVHGKPWMFILRDILQFEESRTSAIEAIQTSNRTCNLIIGVGDGKEGMVNGLEFSGYVAVPYDDVTLLPVNDTWHAPIDNVVYNGMDWNCPNYNVKLNEQLNKFHGSISEVNTIHDILPTVQTGNLHIAVYDLTNSNMHVSFCRPSYAPDTEPHMAYERQFTRLHMEELFAEPNPNVE